MPPAVDTRDRGRVASRRAAHENGRGEQGERDEPGSHSREPCKRASGVARPGGDQGGERGHNGTADGGGLRERERDQADPVQGADDGRRHDVRERGGDVRGMHRRDARKRRRPADEDGQDGDNEAGCQSAKPRPPPGWATPLSRAPSERSDDRARPAEGPLLGGSGRSAAWTAWPGCRGDTATGWNGQRVRWDAEPLRASTIARPTIPMETMPTAMSRPLAATRA